MSKFYLTTPIYYVNAIPHIGHAYTTLASDAIARYYREKIGEDSVFFLTGTDEHGAKIAEAAERDGKNPKLFCDEIATLFVSTWQRLNISHNHFIRTTDEYHEKGAAEFLRALKIKGALYEGDYTGLYCNGCESFITEKQLREDGLCKDHLRKPDRIVEKNWFFKLDEYLQKIQKFIEQGAMRVLPEGRTEEALGLFRQGMENFSVSRPNVRWGIPLPWDNTQTMYVWVEALLNYWTAISKVQSSKFKSQSFWPPDLQIIGKDIIKFHCIYWPAMLLAYYDGDAEKIPKTIFAHGFFTVNGQKMSKTLGNVIDPNDLCDRYGRDGARYLILSQFPFGSDGDIGEGKFDEKYNADLADNLGNLVSRLSMLCAKKIDATARENFWRRTKERFEAMYTYHNDGDDGYGERMRKLELFEVMQRIFSDHALLQTELNDETWYPAVVSAQSINRYITETEVWKKTDQKKIVSSLSVATGALLALARHLKPFLPATSEQIQNCFDIDNQKITVAEPLFPRK